MRQKLARKQLHAAATAARRQGLADSQSGVLVLVLAAASMQGPPLTPLPPHGDSDEGKSYYFANQ